MYYICTQYPSYKCSVIYLTIFHFGRFLHCFLLIGTTNSFLINIPTHIPLNWGAFFSLGWILGNGLVRLREYSFGFGFFNRFFQIADGHVL